MNFRIHTNLLKYRTNMKTKGNFLTLKRSILTSLGLLFFTQVGFSQGVDLDRFFFKANYRNLPQSPLGFDYKTYKVNPSLSKITASLFSPEEIQDKIIIEGFSRVDNDSADLAVSLNVDDIVITRTEIKTRQDVKKDKNGTITSKKDYYWLEMDYTMSAKFNVVDLKKHVTLSSRVLDNRENKHTYKSEETESYKSARDLYQLNKEMMVKNLIQSCLNDYYSYINNFLTTNYGYKVISENLQLWILGSKKHPETAAYSNVCKQIQDAFKLMNPDSSVAAIKESLTPVFEYLNNIPQRYQSDEKGDKKLRYSAYYNLAQMYLALDMPDEAIKCANLIITNDYDTRDGNYFIANAQKLKDLFAKNNFYSRHFVRDVQIF